MARNIGGIAAVILAAGQSRRMGSDKLLLRIDGVPLIRRAIDRAMYGGLAPVLVVTGPDPRPYIDATLGAAGKFMALPSLSASMGDSLHFGLGEVPDANDAAVVLLPDMVHVTAEMIQAVVDRGRAREQAPLVVSRYGKVVAPPFLIRRVLFPEFLAWQGDGWGEPVVHRHRRAAEWIDWPAPQLADVNTPAEFAALRGVPASTPERV